MPGVRNRDRFAPAALPFILAVLTIVFMMAVLRSPTGVEFLDGHDLTNQQYPIYSFIFDSVRDGHGLPLWNPYQFAGQSVVANPQSTIYYPPAWLMVPLGVPRAVGLLVILHLWIGGWGMAQFARQLGATRSGALIGAIVYEFSAVFGAAIGSGHFNYLICQAWLPWIVTGYLWSVGQRRWFFAALPGAAALGMCILTGYPPLLYLVVVWLGGLWIFVSWPYIWGPKFDIGQILRRLYPLLVIGIGGAMLGAAMLLPVGEFTLHTTRNQSASLAFSNSFAMPGGQLITLAFPNMFGNPNLPDQGYWGLPFYEETTAYFGILPLVVVFLAHRIRRRDNATLLVILAALGLVISLGIDGGVFSTLYWLLPGYSLFRVPSKTFYLLSVGIAGLAALVISELQQIEPRLRKIWLNPLTKWVLPSLGGFAVLLSAGMMAYYTIHSADKNPPYRLLYSGNVVGVAIVMILMAWVALRLWQAGHPGAMIVTVFVVLFDLWHVSQPLVTVSALDIPSPWKTVATVVPASSDYRVLTVPDQILWQAGVNYTHHLNAGGYDPLVSNAYQRLIDASQHNPTSPISRLLSVRYAVSEKPFEWLNLPGADQLKLIANKDGWYIYETKDPLPHVFVVPKIEVNTDDVNIRDRLVSGDLDPLKTAVIDRAIDCPLPDNAVSQPAARVVEYQPNAVSVDASGPGFLVLTDAYDSNWTVTVDSSVAPLLRTDTALRGVCLGAGDHHVRFEFRPTAFTVGVVISAVSWTLLFLGGGLYTLRALRN